MRKPVLVFGSFVVDLTSRSQGLPVPGQTLLGSSFRMGAGGKGSNQAVAAHRAGADVTLITKIGRDVFGQVALDFYRAEGMDASQVLIDEDIETGVALILVDECSAQNEIVVVPGACAHITPEDVLRARPQIERASIVLVQLETNFDALVEVISIAYQNGGRVVLNPAPARALPETLLRMVDTITPNETEAHALTGVTVTDEASARRAAQVLLEKGVKNVVITLGALGAFATDGVKSELMPRLDVNAIDTTGAGDAFNGGFVMALSEGHNLFGALRYGNVTGALSVTKLGTAPSMPRRSEIDALFQRHYAQGSWAE